MREQSPIDIRATREEDVAGLTELANLPGVRHGTLRLPFTGERFVRTGSSSGACTTSSRSSAGGLSGRRR